MFDYVLDQLVSFPLLGLSSSGPMTRSNWFQSWIGSIDYDSLFLIPLNYSDSDLLPFAFLMEDGERLSQSHSVGCAWLDPELTQNI